MPEFIEERLSVEIAYGSAFGESYAVEIDETANGNEYRRLRHPYPKLRYDISYEMRDQQFVLDEVLSLYHRCFGRFAGFRVKNLADFSSNGYSGTPTRNDQECAFVSSGVYQLQKEYGGAGGVISVGRPVRTIFKPVAGTVSIGMAGSTIPSWQYSVDNTTGRISFAANKTGAVTGITKAVNAVVTVGSHTFLPMESVVIQGAVGMTQANGVRALIVGTTSTTITLALDTLTFSTYASGGTIQTMPLVSEVVTAGFEFDIPMRFDSDLSQLSFDTFETLSATGINLVEILNP